MSETAVLLVDMMNDYRHPDAETQIPNVGNIIDPLADLVRRARESDRVDLIYVNDNYGDFTAQFSDIVELACNGARPDLVDPIVPAKGSRLLTSCASLPSRVLRRANPMGLALSVGVLVETLG
jgi:nicotinamidase-related amidase